MPSPSVPPMLRSLVAFLDSLSDLIADRARELLAYAAVHPGRHTPPAPPLLLPPAPGATPSSAMPSPETSP